MPLLKSITLNRLKRPETKHPATLSQTDDKIDVSIGGKFFATYNFNKLSQPIIWPLHGPDSIACFAITP